MTNNDGHFKNFAPHSRYKHLVLKAYFEAWLRKLGLGRSAGPMLCYVDACAGRGTDNLGNAGSPLIAADAAADAARQMTVIRGKAPSVSVIAIEKNERHHKLLVEHLKPYAPAAEALLGDLREHLPLLHSRFGDTPTLYFIDPFGLAALPADVVRGALAGPRNEVLLLFADQAALRHFGAAIAEESRATRVHRERVASAPFTLFPEMEIADATAHAPKVARSPKALEITRDRAIQILNAAFGSSAWRAEVESVQESERRAKFRSLYAEFLRACGAPYVLDIPVFSEAGEHAYTLVHASKNDYGYRTMKEAVAAALNKTTLPVDVVSAMRREMSASLPNVVAMLRHRFAGRTVRWTADPTDKTSFSLRRFVLAETAIHHFQLAELDALLKPWRQPGRTKVYAFPPTQALED